MAYDDQLKDKLFRNWIRSALGLKYLKEGLERFVDKQSIEQHANYLSYIANTSSISNVHCENCSLGEILPSHVTNKGMCPYLPKRSCNCNKPCKRRVCPSKVCGILYDLIVVDHVKKNPIWENTDSKKWTNNHWEVAKCFLSTTGYEGKCSASETDETGLLSICLNNNFISTQLADTRKFQQARRVRNETFHTGTCNLEDEKLQDFLDHMIDVLKDSALANDMSAQSAITKLEKLKNDEIQITSDDALEMKTDLVNHEEFRQLKTTSAKLFVDVTNIQKNILELQKRKSTPSDIDQTEKDRLRNFLIHQYKTFYTKTVVSPIYPNKEVDVENIFVPVQIKRQTHENLAHHDMLDNQTYSYLSQIFYNAENKRFNNIFITADAGMGKTTLCRKIISSWCNAHGNEKEHVICDIDWDYDEITKQFSFLFFVSLRHARDENTVEEIIKRQLLVPRFEKVFDQVVQYESETCLIILDGLDEWNPTTTIPSSPRTVYGIPDKTYHDSNYCLLFSSRPWQIERIQPRLRENDAMFYIKGLTEENTHLLIDKVVSVLNGLFGGTVIGPEVDNSLRNTGLVLQHHSPHFLTLCVCLCHSQQSLESTENKHLYSITGLYNGILPLLLKLANDRHRNDERYHEALRLIYQDGIHIPRVLNYVGTISQYSSFLFKIGQLTLQNAFENANKEITCDKQQLRDKVGPHVLALCLKTGIMTEYTIGDLSAIERKTMVSFIHKTFQDYMTALHLCMSIGGDTMSQFLGQCMTENEIEQNAFILRFMCGIDDQKLEQIINHIQTLPWRATVTDEELFKVDRGLAFDCLSQALNSIGIEDACENRLNVNVFEIHIQSNHDLTVLKHIQPGSVKRIVLSSYLCGKETVDTCFQYGTKCLNLMHSFKFVQTVVVKSVFLSHSEVTHILCELPSLKEICLHKVMCNQDESCGCRPSNRGSRMLIPVSTMPRTMNARLCEIDNSPSSLSHISMFPTLLECRLIGFNLRHEKLSYMNMTVLTKLCLKRVTLTHTQVNQILCTLPSTTDIDLENLSCCQDYQCGCGRESNKPEWKDVQMGVLNIARLHAKTSPKALFHITNAPILKELVLVDNLGQHATEQDSECIFPNMQSLTSGLPVLTNLKLESVQISHTDMKYFLCHISTLRSVQFSSVVCSSDENCGCETLEQGITEPKLNYKTKVREISITRCISVERTEPDTTDAGEESFDNEYLQCLKHISGAPRLEKLVCSRVNEIQDLVDVLILPTRSPKLKLLELKHVLIPLNIVKEIIDLHSKHGIRIVLHQVTPSDDVNETYSWLFLRNGIDIVEWEWDRTTLRADIHVSADQVYQTETETTEEVPCSIGDEEQRYVVEDDQTLPHLNLAVVNEQFSMLEREKPIEHPVQQNPRTRRRRPRPCVIL